ncbi:MAG: Asp-tRNA(Asn)/Glu-tRNA(Gln) amidotransferase subunit GatC [bacterium]
MTSTSLTDDSFSKLVTQANLTLSADQQAKIRLQLDEALQAIGVLKELDTTKVKITSSASGLTNVWREDTVQPSFSQTMALQNSAHTHNGYFMVPAIFEPKDT